MAPSRHDWKIVDWDVKPQHNQPKPVLSTTSSSLPFYDQAIQFDFQTPSAPILESTFRHYLDLF